MATLGPLLATLGREPAALGPLSGSWAVVVRAALDGSWALGGFWAVSGRSWARLEPPAKPASLKII